MPAPRPHLFGESRRARSRVSAVRLIFLAWLVLAAGAHASAQVWTGPTEPKAAPKTTPPPTRPKAAPRPAPRRAAPAPRVAPLTLQYRVLKVEPTGTQVEVSPATAFSHGDRIRFGFKASEDGYVYVIRQRAPGQPGRILYPDARINGGQNRVRKNQEYSVPSDCGPEMSAWHCTFPVDGGNPQDFYTLIFSRDARINLPADFADANGDITAPALARHWADSRQRLSTEQRGDTIFSTRVTNHDARAGGELVIRYLLSKRRKN
ncbi:MAG TPA: DUF4384 domain-containing protein [Pyrinomonadaceae bacterium]|nr:DUF4384 domain-containing protein [Pyrinomonadaceae bacterium]